MKFKDTESDIIYTIQKINIKNEPQYLMLTSYGNRDMYSQTQIQNLELDDKWERLIK